MRSLERTAALLEDRAGMERLLHDAANYAWEHYGPTSSRAFYNRVRVALANYDALLAEVARLRALPEGKATVWMLREQTGIVHPITACTDREKAAQLRDRWNEWRPAIEYCHVVALAVVEDHTPTGENT